MDSWSYKVKFLKKFYPTMLADNPTKDLESIVNEYMKKYKVTKKEEIKQRRLACQTQKSDH